MKTTKTDWKKHIQPQFFDLPTTEINRNTSFNKHATLDVTSGQENLLSKRATLLYTSPSQKRGLPSNKDLQGCMQIENHSHAMTPQIISTFRSKQSNTFASRNMSHNPSPVATIFK
jgi:hypothetical protein